MGLVLHLVCEQDVGDSRGLLRCMEDSKAWALVEHMGRKTQSCLQSWYRRQLCTAAIRGGLVQAGTQLSTCLSSNLEKSAALQFMGLASLPGFVGTLSEKGEIWRGEQVLYFSMCILWLCRFFHWVCSPEVSLVTEPKWIKEVFIHSPRKNIAVFSSSSLSVPCDTHPALSLTDLCLGLATSPPA